MAPICANKSDRKSYMTEIDGFSVLLTFPKPKANRSRKPRQFHDFFTFAGGCLIKTDPVLQDCLQYLEVLFAREENAITRRWQNQKHTVHCKGIGKKTASWQLTRLGAALLSKSTPVWASQSCSRKADSLGKILTRLRAALLSKSDGFGAAPLVHEE